ncbi:uncharacterized protein YgbK (DUF1537 family) [Stackebrandtia endophytica]|uniref:Uncharacterized protein YgbK (DUF1537 family) n=1 Tax=Stackebrandtia endophytica TaxID=1496996 RepID=A0A543ATJ7_9ACTN|nr:four-carbon acid sugar kinase family protein [Stackebrandtia endophytica]TQL75903.1 uncharacterized protein YgbK (DUF1537 family) [Stackebrandtia endophytica]
MMSHASPLESGIRTVVLDDDPTGTQSATGVHVLFSWDETSLRHAFTENPSVYVLTNTRSVDRSTAVALVSEIRDNARAAAASLGAGVRFVLRGDSTLRGHVFAESEQFMTSDSVMVFVPAFPEGGRQTLDNVHYVMIDGVATPVHRTEFAADPVFPFTSTTLADYVREKSSLTPVGASLSEVRSDALATMLEEAAAGSVVLPDVEDNDDIRRIGTAIREAAARGRDIVVRCGAPLAAELAGVVSTETFTPAGAPPESVLLVCGSHTFAAGEQLRALEGRWGPSLTLSTPDAMADPAAAGRQLAARAKRRLADQPIVVIASERDRLPEHGTLHHGQRVMEALITCVETLVEHVDLVVSKGGITSAEVAQSGIGADSALVRGQIRPGISVWQLTDRNDRPLELVVVPGNVGSKDTLVDIIDAYEVGSADSSRSTVPA